MNARKNRKAIKRGNGRKRVRRRGIGKKIKTKRRKEKKVQERENTWEQGASSWKKSLRLQQNRNKPDKLVRLSKSTPGQ